MIRSVLSLWLFTHTVFVYRRCRNGYKVAWYLKNRIKYR